MNFRPIDRIFDSADRNGVVLVLWWLLIAIALLRVPLPINETRHLAVAWAMWLHDDWLVPHLNGAAYSAQPPLLFWLINSGWRVFGVDVIWPLLVPVLFQVASLALGSWLARRLWPTREALPRLVPLLLTGTLFWTMYSTALMVDFLMTFWVLLGIVGLVLADDGTGRRGWMLLALAVGGGLLSEGAVVLIYLVPAGLLAPLWRSSRRSRRYWYAGFGSAIGAGIGLFLAWAIPAALVGGADFARAILQEQLIGQLDTVFTGGKPWWWYLPLLPLLLFPWLLWPTAWQSSWQLRAAAGERGTRLVVVWLSSSLIGLSTLSSKEPYYLLPLFPAFALLLGRGLCALPPRSERSWLPVVGLLIWGVALTALPWAAARREDAFWLATASPLPGLAVCGLAGFVALTRGDWRQRAFVLSSSTLVLVMLMHLAVVRALLPAYDTEPTGRYLASLQAEAIPVAHLGRYYGQFDFAGRLHGPLTELDSLQALRRWAADHPRGRVIVYYKPWPLPLAKKPEFMQPYRNDGLAVWSVERLLADPSLQARLKY